MTFESEARTLARKDYLSGKVNIVNYPTVERYVNEWWEERYLHLVQETSTMTARSEVYKALDSERDYQDHRWAGYAGLDGKHESATDRTLDEFILYMEEYLRKAREASVSGDEAESLNAVRKVTALGVGCMERLGAPQREGYER